MRSQQVLGILFVLVLPIGSWIEGSRLFAWSMFSSVGTYRIEARAVDADGRVAPINPTALARRGTASTASYLAGADHWRSGGSLAIFRAHLDEVASLACADHPRSAIQLVLREKRSGGEVATSARAECP
jgi:hypothetical protein